MLWRSNEHFSPLEITILVDSYTLGFCFVRTR
jgi:hypothetical protein